MTEHNPVLHGPVFPTMLRMATPNALAFVVQATVNMTEVWYVGQLGTTSLAAMAFIFPGLMLMQMLSGGAMGGATASAVARALGSGRTEDAHRLVWHALMLAISIGIGFTVLYLFIGEALLMAMGAREAALDEALSYGNILFGGVVAVWCANVMTGVFRGMGEMRFPAMLMAGGGIVQAILSGTLVLGWFGVPSLGIRGAAISVLVVSSSIAVLALCKLYLGKQVVRLKLENRRLEAVLFIDILRVGSLAAVSPFLSISSIMIVNGVISRFGDAVVAGYGIGSRLEFLLVPMVMGFGIAMNTMVGMNVGNRNIERAEHIAFVGGSAATLVTGIVGLTLAIFPHAWIGIFTDDPQTLAAGANYLRISGWAFAFQGMGLSLFFASQGAGTVVWPVIANFLRFGGAGGAALAVLVLGLSVEWAFISLAIGMTLYGIVTAGSIWLGAWRKI